MHTTAIYNTKPIPLEHREEIMRLIKNNSSPVNTGYSSPCWIWKGGLDGSGYPRIRCQGKRYRAHRLSLAAFRNQQLGQLLACHHCDTPTCVNPEHLFLGTTQDNVNDKIEKNRINPAKGNNHWKSKLKENDIIHIFLLNAQKVPYSDIAKRFSVSDACISDIISRNTWKHVSVPLHLLGIPKTLKPIQRKVKPPKKEPKWRKGENHPGSKLTDKNILEIFQLKANGALCKEIAEQYGIHPIHVSRILGRVYRKDVVIPSAILEKATAHRMTPMHTD